ncbi:MAG: 1-deoxy-D-xylulose-5-phosphate reductoisomerase, partial [Verrucomicrobiota bacterium]
MPSPKKVVLLGATGSIGESTRRVVAKHPDKLELLAIAGRRRWRELAVIAKEFNVPHVAIYDEAACEEAKESGEFPTETQLHCGLEGLIAVSILEAAELVVPSIVGTLSLKPTLAALEHGKNIALASKEILVLAGHFVMETAKKYSATVLPLDSEHNAIF